MKLSETEVKSIVDAVKKEPRTVQDIALLIDKSWVTAEKYLQELHHQTGAINLKTFRQGTQAALKIVYYASTEGGLADEVKQGLAQRILQGKFKQDFDFLDVFQFIPDAHKKAFARDSAEEDHMTLEELVKKKAAKTLYYFSGNLSFLSLAYKGKKAVVDFIEEQLEEGVYVKILCRVNISSLANIEKISHLLVKYPNQIEVRHRYQPLRGFIVDGDFARFKTWENKDDYKLGELQKSTRVYYEVYSPEWVAWLQNVFWSMWRSSISYEKRVKEVQRIVAGTA